MCLELGKLTPATQLDHITPLSQGGEDCESNFQGLCAKCHGRKSVECDGALGRKRKTKKQGSDSDESTRANEGG